MPGLGLEANFYGLGLKHPGLRLGLESSTDNYFSITFKKKKDNKMIIVIITNQ